MKKTTIFAMMSTILVHLSSAQEFSLFNNGLIYSPEAIDNLKTIVDSLNLKHLSCEAYPSFNSVPQTNGTLVFLNGKDLSQAKDLMSNNQDLEAFQKQFPSAELWPKIMRASRHEDQEYWITALETEDYSRSTQVTSTEYNRIQSNLDRWVISSNGKSDSGIEYLYAFYLPTPFKSSSLKHNYAKMIAYVDCMVDTTTLKMKADQKRGRVYLPKNWMSFKKSKKEELLDKLRGTRVVGTCSMDSSPRDHALNIAKVSAESNHWEVFLRAHLDILNDHVDRVSDGSWAWQARKTYIKELEEIDIDVNALLLGISLRIDNPSENHYFGSISRVGRSLAESKNRDTLVTQLFQMLQDPQLDPYNRAMAYLLFRHMNYNISDITVRKTNAKKLNEVVQRLPSFYKETMYPIDIEQISSE